MSDKAKDIVYQDFLGYKKDEPVSNWGYAKMSKLIKFYGPEVTLKTVEQCRRQVYEALSRLSFDSEMKKMNYVIAIIENHIRDVYKQHKKDEEKKIKSNKEIDYFEDRVAPDKKPVVAAATKDLSRFLGE